jgi:DNA-binding NarL/FixJ family response regulator
VPKSILIADDSPLILKMLRDTLEAEGGWKVCDAAANGQEAIEKAQQLKPDLIVLDLAMPVMNGLEAARELTSLLPSIPLLMFTNYETAQLKWEAGYAGIRAVVSKNAPIETLLNSIQALLGPRPERVSTSPQRIETGKRIADG